VYAHRSPSTPAPSPPAAAQPPTAPHLPAAPQTEPAPRPHPPPAQSPPRLSDAQQADIRRLAALAQPPLDRLRAYHLENSDGPALYLKPLVEREKKPAAPATKPTAKSGSPKKNP